MTASPRIPDRTLTGYPAASAAPRPHTDAELRCLLEMLHDKEIRTVSVGHGRHCASIAAGRAFTDAWVVDGGTVLGTVSLPHNMIRNFRHDLPGHRGLTTSIFWQHCRTSSSTEAVAHCKYRRCIAMPGSP